MANELLSNPDCCQTAEELAAYWRGYASTVERHNSELRQAMQRIIDNRDNKNWRKSEIVHEVERALRMPLGVNP